MPDLPAASFSPGRITLGSVSVEVGPLRFADATTSVRVAIGNAARREESQASLVTFAPVVGRQALTASAHHTQYAVGPMSNTLDLASQGEASQLRTAVSVGVVFSLGIVGWAARGVALMTSVLVASPAWGSYDLLPVLRRRREDADWGDDGDDDESDADARAAFDRARRTSASTGRRDHEALELK